jgi:hypothetical protein
VLQQQEAVLRVLQESLADISPEVAVAVVVVARIHLAIKALLEMMAGLAEAVEV